MSTDTTTGNDTDTGPDATTEPATMEQINEVDATAVRVAHRGRMLGARVIDMWVELAPVDPGHPLHVKPGDPHWHLWIDAEDQTPRTAENPFTILRDAADELAALACHLTEHAEILEAVRDATRELDGLDIADTSDGTRLMSLVIQLNWNIKEAARVRNLANRASVLGNDARMVAGWAFVPPQQRPATYARHNQQAENTRLLRQRLNGLVDRINKLGDHTKADEGGGFRIVSCTETDCEILAAAHAENSETEPATANA